MTHAELLAAGYDLDAAAHARLDHFVRVLVEENRRLNLTGAASGDDLWRLHVCDSLALLPLLRAKPPRRLLDIGAGGGLPGLPIACCCPDVAVTLLDATRKKVAAIRRMIAALGLENVQALWGRAEVLAHDPAHREQYDAVTARAVAELRVLLEYATGFIQPGGLGYFFKTPASLDAELRAAAESARACGLEHVKTRDYELTDRGAGRAILVYRKRSPLAAHLPRPPGRARKRPL